MSFIALLTYCFLVVLITFTPADEKAGSTSVSLGIMRLFINSKRPSSSYFSLTTGKTAKGLSLISFGRTLG